MRSKSMKRRFLVAFATLCLAGQSGNLIGQDREPEKDIFAEILKVEAKGLSDDGIEEILRIRKQLGGGTGLENDATTSGPLVLTGSTQLGQEPQTPSRRMIRDSKSPSTVKIAAIRSVARRLDGLAADLEDIELYSEADNLRTLAAQLRHRVRRGIHAARQPEDPNRKQ